MTIATVHPNEDFTLTVVASDGRVAIFGMRPYLNNEAFQPLRDFENFRKVRSGGYYIEWECEADLSADTIESKWVPSIVGSPITRAAEEPPRYGSR